MLSVADNNLAEILEEELLKNFENERQNIREEAKQQIAIVQKENVKTFNKHRKEARKYKVDDFVAIQRTQFATGAKLFPKFFGPYRVVQVKRNDRYGVKKVGDHDGPVVTSTSADLMKSWADEAETNSSESDE